MTVGSLTNGQGTNGALAALLTLRARDHARALALQGIEGCALLTEALDQAVIALIEGVPGSSAALMAVGAYGRRELTRHADIEALVVAASEIEAEPVVAALEALRAAGLAVAFEIVSLESLAGRQRPELLMQLLDARLILGDRPVFEAFLVARKRLLAKERGTLREALMALRNRRLATERWQLQEPDLVRGRGGLNELQTVRWLATADAIAHGLSTNDTTGAGDNLEAAASTLLTTRAALHALADFPDDRYRSYSSTGVAEVLGLDWVECGQRLMRAMRVIDAAAARAFAPRRRSMRLLQRVFGQAPSPAPSTQVTTIDRARLTAALRDIDEAGLDPVDRAAWLERVIPEWEPLRGLPNPLPVHQHPIDVHSVLTVIEARSAMAEDRDRMSSPAVAELLASRDELLLAAFLHDIGFAHGDDHSRAGGAVAGIVAARLGLAAEAVRRLVTVVDQHQLLLTTASRRNIGDEQVIASVAEAVGDSPTLHLLYLLSIADARACSDASWDIWKAAQLRTLYVRVLEYLIAQGDDDSPPLARQREAIQAELADRFDAASINAHLEALSDSYVLATQPAVVGDHLELIAEAAGGTAIRRDRQGDLERLTLVTHDRPGLLSVLAGTLAVYDISILGGNVYSRADGAALDVLYVQDGQGGSVDKARWSEVEAAIKAAVDGNFSIDERLRAAPHVRRHRSLEAQRATVRVDNAESETYTIIEVTAQDRVGLLYAITKAIHELRIDIHLAKVETLGAEVMDAFYVRRENGQRIEAPDEIERVGRRIRDAVRALDD